MIKKPQGYDEAQAYTGEFCNSRLDFIYVSLKR